MLVFILALAGIGFGLLVLAVATGSVAWAWGCIGVCAIGAVLLLVHALDSRSEKSDTADH